MKELEVGLKKAGPDEKSQLERKIDRRRKWSEAIAQIMETYQQDVETPAPKNRKRPPRKGPKNDSL